MSEAEELKVIKHKLNIIKQSGFGEIRIVVRNGIVYRILSVKDELVEPKQK
jgi:hypothetical protein